MSQAGPERLLRTHQLPLERRRSPKDARRRPRRGRRRGDPAVRRGRGRRDRGGDRGVAGAAQGSRHRGGGEQRGHPQRLSDDVDGAAAVAFGGGYRSRRILQRHAPAAEGHAGQTFRPHRQHRLAVGNQGTARTDQLFGGQRRRDRGDEGAGAGGGQEGRDGKRHRAGIRTHGHDRRPRRSGTQKADTCRTLLRGGGGRRSGDVPHLGQSLLHHG